VLVEVDGLYDPWNGGVKHTPEIVKLHRCSHHGFANSRQRYKMAGVHDEPMASACDLAYLKGEM
jgi:hypothetical protein